MIRIWERALERMDVMDIGLVKFSSMAFILFIITVWPAAMSWVHSVNAWWFLVAFLVISVRPVYRSYFK